MKAVFRIRDSGSEMGKNLDPGSAMNIPGHISKVFSIAII
jgi:hypothetical protein